MAGYVSTIGHEAGDTGPGFAVKSQQAGYSKTTDVQENMARQYALAYSRTRFGMVGPVVGERPSRPTPGISRSRAEVADVNALNAVIRGARQAAESLRNSPDDAVELALRVDDIALALECFWDYRGLRESDWGDLVNILQTMVKQSDAEDLSVEKRLALADAVDKCLCLPGLRLADVRRALKRLTRAGFDLWSGISERDLGDDGE